MVGPPWTIRVSRRAQADIQSIRRWTEFQPGEEQAQRYAQLVIDTLDELRVRGIDTLGVKTRDGVAKGLCSLDLARRGQKGRHVILFRRSDSNSRILLVLRILHDAMDWGRQVR